jgi:hypothetical protein
MGALAKASPHRPPMGNKHLQGALGLKDAAPTTHSVTNLLASHKTRGAALALPSTITHLPQQRGPQLVLQAGRTYFGRGGGGAQVRQRVPCARPPIPCAAHTLGALAT